jgi:hypothetical protein
LMDTHAHTELCTHPQRPLYSTVLHLRTIRLQIDGGGVGPPDWVSGVAPFVPLKGKAAKKIMGRAD